VEQDANIVFETPDAAGTEFVAYRSWVTANTLAPGSAPTFAQATNIADNAAAGRVATNDARYLAALTNAAAFDAAGSSAAVTNGAATGTNTTGTVFANGIARSVGTNTPWTSSCVLTSAIPGPGCTDLGSGAAVTLSGSTVSYTANPATAYTVAVTAAAPRYVYALQIVSTNACTLASGLSLQGSWTITGTNILAIVPCTGNVWRVYGRGL
jgi:hypothetical protein